MPDRAAALRTATTIRSLMIVFIGGPRDIQAPSPEPRVPSPRPASVYLVQNPRPPRLGEEAPDGRQESPDLIAQTVLLVLCTLRFVRPVHHQGAPLDVVARQEAPIAAVLRVVAVVAHDEVVVGRHGDRPVLAA